MLTNLYDWAVHHSISTGAMAELRALMDVSPYTPAPTKGYSDEAMVQQSIRLEAPKRGVTLWRNNVGVLTNEYGVPIRFGLANDTKAINQRIKSSDLIGITPRVVTPLDVGKTFGIFTSIEVKKSNWVYVSTPTEKAQLAWIQLIQRLGGFARFARGIEDIW